MTILPGLIASQSHSSAARLGSKYGYSLSFDFTSQTRLDMLHETYVSLDLDFIDSAYSFFEPDASLSLDFDEPGISDSTYTTTLDLVFGPCEQYQWFEPGSHQWFEPGLLEKGCAA
jgi:hypothetical protein